MRQAKATTSSRKGKHLTRDERIQIEVLLKKKHSVNEIAELLGRHRRTIEREINRGEVIHQRSDLSQVHEYSSDRAQMAHDLAATAKGPNLKIGSHHDTAEFIRMQIVEKRRSPEVVAYLLDAEGWPGAVCAKTIYNYIESQLIAGVSNESLWDKRKRKSTRRKTLHRKTKTRPQRRESIEERPEKVETREEFGHWEIDLVVGGKDAKKPVLMTLVERRTRRMLIRKLSDRTQQSVLKALGSIERTMGTGRFRAQFKSITADNGSEFLDVEAMEQSAFSSKKRTKMYYAHAYASWERGSNENGNKMIRRFIAKGSCISKYTHKRIKEIEDWINEYPRKVLGFKTASELFVLEAAAG